MKYHLGVNSGWVRICGRLLHWTRQPPLFSERHGYVQYHVVPLTKWRIRLTVSCID